MYSFIVILMYFILLNKLRFDQISCSGRSGTRWQYRVPKWYEIVKRLGTPAVESVLIGLSCLHMEVYEMIHRCKQSLQHCLFRSSLRWQAGKEICFTGFIKAGTTLANAWFSLRSISVVPRSLTSNTLMVFQNIALHTSGPRWWPMCSKWCSLTLWERTSWESQPERISYIQIWFKHDLSAYLLCTFEKWLQQQKYARHTQYNQILGCARLRKCLIKIYSVSKSIKQHWMFEIKLSCARLCREVASEF